MQLVVKLLCHTHSIIPGMLSESCALHYTAVQILLWIALHRSVEMTCEEAQARVRGCV